MAARFWARLDHRTQKPPRSRPAGGVAGEPGASAPVVAHKSASAPRPVGTVDNSPAIYRWVRWANRAGLSPVGTVEFAAFSRPYGTFRRELLCSPFPAVNCWAILKCPYGARIRRCALTCVQQRGRQPPGFLAPGLTPLSLPTSNLERLHEMGVSFCGDEGRRGSTGMRCKQFSILSSRLQIETVCHSVSHSKRCG